MDHPACASCRFWEPVAGDSGECRIRSVERWPVRAASEWCGEFQPIPVAPLRMDPGRGLRARTNAVPGAVPTE